MPRFDQLQVCVFTRSFALTRKMTLKASMSVIQSFDNRSGALSKHCVVLREVMQVAAEVQKFCEVKLRSGHRNNGMKRLRRQAQSHVQSICSQAKSSANIANIACAFTRALLSGVLYTS